jgi:hypothetical protein
LEKYFPLKIGNFQGQCEFGGESAPKPNPIEIRKEHTWGKGWKIWGKNMLVFSLLDVPTQVVSYTFLPI